MIEPEHGFVHGNGIRMHYVEAGEGPLVVLCHGWPESWYSWRHQLPALAQAGFRAVAPDQRGYGRTASLDDLLEAFPVSRDLLRTKEPGPELLAPVAVAI